MVHACDMKAPPGFATRKDISRQDMKTYEIYESISIKLFVLVNIMSFGLFFALRSRRE